MISRREFVAFVAGLPLLPGFEKENPLLAGLESSVRDNPNGTDWPSGDLSCKYVTPFDGDLDHWRGVVYAALDKYQGENDGTVAKKGTDFI